MHELRLSFPVMLFVTCRMTVGIKVTNLPIVLNEAATTTGFGEFNIKSFSTTGWNLDVSNKEKCEGVIL